MPALDALTTAAIVLAGFLFVYLFVVKGQKKAPLPPGPKGKLIVGNLGDLPPKGSAEWLHWLKHRELYGPISSVSVMGQTVIIINDAKVAVDVLDKRSSLHSSRPRLVFSGEMLGAEKLLNSLTYSNRFRLYRKHMGRLIGTSAALSRYDDLQEVEAGRFVLRVLENPDKLTDHIRKEAAAIMLKLSYNYTVEPHGRDPLIDLADEVLDIFSKTAGTGTYLVNFIPALKHIPAWFPGAAFKRQAIKWRRLFIDLADRPYAFVQDQIRQGTNKLSYVTDLLQEENIDEEFESMVKWSSASLYGGAADTTVSSISCFFLAMAQYPEVQKKAQDEIDSVVGSSRLPELQDRKNLPYIDAIVQEVLRWHPVAPMGLPHMSSEDDIYDGHLIPKGALIMANIWAFLHDPEVFHDPEIFKPERFLGVDGCAPQPDPRTYAFGFGRRVCPGRVLADNSLYLTIVKTLATLTISNWVEDGREIETVAEMLPGIISHPKPFKLTIRVRDPDHEKLIRTFESENPWPKSDADALKGISTGNE